MAFLDVALTVGIISFIVLVVWSKIQNQRMYDTIMEIRDILRDVGGKGVEKVKK